MTEPREPTPDEMAAMRQEFGPEPSDYLLAQWWAAREGQNIDDADPEDMGHGSNPLVEASLRDATRNIART